MKLISDGSDLEGIEKTQDIKYIKMLRLSMWAIDSWPKSPNESKVYKYMMTIKWITVVTGGIMYLRNNFGKKSSFELGQTYITVFMTFIAGGRSVLLITDKYNKIVFEFFNKMHLFNFSNKSEYAFKTHILVHKISNFYTILVIFMMIMGIIMYNLTPLYNNYANGMFSSEGLKNNGTFDHAIFYVLPFDSLTNLRGYLVIFTINWLISHTCSSYYCVVDLTICLMVFHVWGHIRLLTYNLINFPRPASLLIASRENKGGVVHKYTEEESKVIFSKLRECIHHHSLILDFILKMSDALGAMIALFYIFNQVAGCLLLLMCSPMDTKSLVRYGPLTLISFQQMIQVSIIFELLESSNDKLIDAVYSLPWEYMEPKHSKLVFIMLRQSQKSLHVKALSMIPVGVGTMTAIMKTSFSYFVMLRTVADEE